MSFFITENDSLGELRVTLICYLSKQYQCITVGRIRLELCNKDIR